MDILIVFYSLVKQFSFIIWILGTLYQKMEFIFYLMKTTQIAFVEHLDNIQMSFRK